MSPSYNVHEGPAADATGPLALVELIGIEPTACTLRTYRSPN